MQVIPDCPHLKSPGREAEPVRKQIVERLEAGERVEPRAVNDMIWTAKQEVRKAAEEAKLTDDERQSRKGKAARKLRNEQRRQKEWDREERKHEEEEARQVEAATKVAAELAPTAGDQLDDWLFTLAGHQNKHRFYHFLGEAVHKALTEESNKRHSTTP